MEEYLLKKYIIDNKLFGKNFFNQKFFDPIALNWSLYIDKSWYISNDDEILKTSFIKLSKNN